MVNPQDPDKKVGEENDQNISETTQDKKAIDLPAILGMPNSITGEEHIVISYGNPSQWVGDGCGGGCAACSLS
jgi:hypothetical protein